jgi:hypothetical protein
VVRGSWFVVGRWLSAVSNQFSAISAIFANRLFLGDFQKSVFRNYLAAILLFLNDLSDHFPSFLLRSTVSQFL